MSTLKVNAIRGTGASSDAISVNSTDGTCTAKITNPKSFRNLLINGQMIISQRSTSTASISSGTTHVLDRWGLEVTSGGSAAVTMSQSSTAPAGFSKSLKIDVTTADASLDAGERWQVRQRIEGQDLAHLNYGTSYAKKVIFSFWVRSNLTGTFAVGLYQDDGGKVNSGNYTISSANTWEKKTIAINGNTSDAMNVDNTLGFQVGIGLGAGTNYTAGSATGNWSATTNTQFPSQTNVLASTSNDLYFTGCQLEVDDGSGVASDFEYKTFAHELERCKRYYQAAEGKFKWAWDGLYANGAGAGLSIYYALSPEMRAAATVTHNVDDKNNVSSSTIETSTDSIRVGCTCSSSGRTAMTRTNSSGYIRLDAEL